jgi:hypothetical protein
LQQRGLHRNCFKISESVMDEHFNSGPAQFGFDLGDTIPAKSYEPDRDEIRAELNEILAQARGATSGPPWDERTFQYHKTVFPQMANWLPAEERDQLRVDFAQEIARIGSLPANAQ